MHHRRSNDSLCEKLLARLTTFDSATGGSDMAQLSLYCQRVVLYLRPSQPTASTVCAEKQTIGAPKASAVKAPTGMRHQTCCP